MIDNKQLSACRAAARHLPSAERWRFQMRVMVGCLHGCALNLPHLAREALDAASRYWRSSDGSPDALADWRAICWRHLERTGSPAGPTDTQASGIRAVLCVLHAEDVDDAFVDEALGWFAIFLDKLGNFERQFDDALAQEVSARSDGLPR